MWRLKIADGGKDPNIFSRNNFVGRQTWVFDPDAGTPEERAQVETARKNFYDNRFKVKPCKELLWCFHVVISSLYQTKYTITCISLKMFINRTNSMQISITQLEKQ